SANTNEHVHSSDISPATKPVLKSRAKPESISASDDQGSSSNDAARGSSAKRSVTFRDGLHPGCGSNETETSTAGSKSKKHDSKRPHKSWRLQQLHVTEECVCLLPNVDIASSNIDEASATDSRFRSTENKCLYLRNSDGTITECDNILEQITSLKNFEPVEVMIFRNFSCKIKLCKCEFFFINF
ncbi:unnamed protein product, partial [Onchocerca flexuosa]|uniref:Doublecortin domain-containing protein n=1 Tax=Onchocerca flexuosa TaxID=387005 RepID=A0A183HQN3_9BILA